LHYFGAPSFKLVYDINKPDASPQAWLADDLNLGRLLEAADVPLVRNVSHTVNPHVEAAFRQGMPPTPRSSMKKARRTGARADRNSIQWAITPRSQSGVPIAEPLTPAFLQYIDKLGLQATVGPKTQE
jgi:hypothetical protein